MKIILASLIIVLSTVAFGLLFKTSKIKVASITLDVEIAQTDEEQKQGLMFRKELRDGKGMLFVFRDEQQRQFWMKNTFIDLSIGYFNANKILVDIQDMKAVTSELDENPPTYPSKKAAKYALEAPLGWFKKHKIKLGDKLVLE